MNLCKFCIFFNDDHTTVLILRNSMQFKYIQSSAIITRFNIVKFFKNNYKRQNINQMLDPQKTHHTSP